MIPALSGAGADIAEICLRFHVRRLDLFGSAARETDFTEQSDIDLLVEYEPGCSPPTLADFLALRDALSTRLGRKVDLVMAGAVRNPYLSAAIERSRRPLHGA
jgi:predicted nucleotidyltransferase